MLGLRILEIQQSLKREMPMRWSQWQFVLQGLLATSVVLLALAARPITSVADDGWASLNAKMAYSGIDLGKQYELCREYDRGIRQWSAPAHDCGVALPSGNAEFRLPKWKALDPAENLDLVRDIFYWMNALSSRLWDPSTFAHLQLSRPDVVPEMRDAVWLPARSYVMQLIVDHRFELQRSRIDVNFDGKPEWVYRMSRVALNRTFNGKDRSPPIQIYDETCKKDDEPGDARQYFYYVPAEDNLPAHLFFRRTGYWGYIRLMYWRNRIYELLSHDIEEFTPLGDDGGFVAKPVCRFRYRPNNDSQGDPQ